MLLEEHVERGEAAQDVLRQVGAIDPEDQIVATTPQQLPLKVGDARPGGHLLDRVGVDRERVVADPDLATVDRDDAGRVIDLEPKDVLAALQEVAAIGASVEADDVVREDAAVDVLTDRRGEHPPGVRLAPRDVHEVMQERVGPGPADQGREGVELIVVDHHDWPLDVPDLLQHGPRQILVHDVVAELEGLGFVTADVRGVGLVPQVVLDEPQQRVREDVVEAVVRLGFRGDQLDPVLAAARGADRERMAAVAFGHRHILIGHRRGDPGDVAMGRESDQCGHKAAGPAADLSVWFERDGATVRNEHQRS